LGAASSEGAFAVNALSRYDLVDLAPLKAWLADTGRLAPYEAFLSNPLCYLDSLGLAGKDVHKEMTDDMAEKHGVAKTTTKRSWGTMDNDEDTKHPELARHFRRPKDAFDDLLRAVEICDEEGFASALHQWQDALTHPPGGWFLGYMLHLIFQLITPHYGFDPDRTRYKEKHLIDQSRSSRDVLEATDMAFAIWSAVWRWDDKNKMWIRRGWCG